MTFSFYLNTLLYIKFFPKHYISINKNSKKNYHTITKKKEEETKKVKASDSFVRNYLILKHLLNIFLKVEIDLMGATRMS